MFLTMTAKELNPQVTVIARASEENVEPRLLRGGADKVISPYQSASARILHAAIRPTAVEFLELLTQREHLQLSLEEVLVCPGSDLVDRSLGDSQVRGNYGVVVVAIKNEDDTTIFNPDAPEVVQAGDTLVVIGKDDQLRKLGKACGTTA